DRNPSKNRTQSSRLRQRSANFSSLLDVYHGRDREFRGENSLSGGPAALRLKFRYWGRELPL
ncbi:hypothetical protein ACC684_35345, partial [Rhizobium ruizarguesonis]